MKNFIQIIPAEVPICPGHFPQPVIYSASAIRFPADGKQIAFRNIQIKLTDARLYGKGETSVFTVTFP